MILKGRPISEWEEFLKSELKDPVTSPEVVVVLEAFLELIETYKRGHVHG